MEIKYLKELEGNVFVNNFTRKGLSLSDIQKLESTYNSGKPFPQAFRELLYLAGEMDFTGVITGKVDRIQREAKESLNYTQNQIDRPFFAFNEWSGNFLFFYLDESAPDPDIYVGQPYETDQGEPLVKRSGAEGIVFTLSGLVSESLYRAKNGLSW